MMSGKTRVHVLISGRVQGVAYRFFAEKWANSLDVTGWVRNLHDGRVEVLAEGDRPNIDRFLERLRAGPRLAQLDDFEIRWDDYTGEFSAFLITFSGDS
jgi:acylphosphatase